MSSEVEGCWSILVVKLCSKFGVGEESRCGLEPGFTAFSGEKFRSASWSTKEGISSSQIV